VWNVLSIPEESKYQVLQLAEEAERGIAGQVDIKIAKSDHAEWLRIKAEPLSHFAGHIDWQVNDITDDYERTRLVREEREKLIDFTDHAPLGFFSVDELGKFVFVMQP
jgi:two-component system cell cycle sensor histidine kinase/response regulator CckA